MSGDTALPGHTSPELQRFADAVLIEGKNLLVVRSDPDALHSIIQSLQTLWQARAPQWVVEHFSGRLSAGLLGLINATLAEQALPAEMKGMAHEPPRHLCVVHDAECLSQDELLLLQRVIEHFPSWQTRLVLLFKSAPDTSEKLHRLLQQPGKGLVIWQLHTPSPQPTAATPVRGLKPWLMGTGGLLLLGAAVVWLRPPHSGPANGPTSVSLAPTATTAPTATSAESNAATAAQPQLPSSVPTDRALAQADPAPPVLASPPAPPASAPASAPPQVIANAAPQGTEAAPVPVPDAAARGQRWLAALPKEFFVLVHSRHESLLQAQRTIERRPELSNARVVMLNTAATEPTQFLVLTGPFRSEDRAQNYKLRQKLSASARIESIRSVLQKSRAGPKAKR